jgi:hypothetical protein
MPQDLSGIEAAKDPRFYVGEEHRGVGALHVIQGHGLRQARLGSAELT